jgi:uncharacterized membrane protein
MVRREDRRSRHTATGEDRHGMSQIRMTTHFDAPIERVFDLGTDFKRFPEWNVSYSEVKQVSGPPHEVGTKVFAVMKVLGRSIEGAGEIVEADRPRMLKMVGEGIDGGSLTSTYRFTPTDSGTDLEVSFDYELPAGIIGQIADRLFVERAIERDVRHSFENFKALVEAPAPTLA